MDSFMMCGCVSVCVSEISVLDKPRLVRVQVCLVVCSPLCNAEDKLCSEVIRCGLYSAFCQLEEKLPCLSLLLRLLI